MKDSCGTKSQHDLLCCEVGPQECLASISRGRSPCTDRGCDSLGGRGSSTLRGMKRYGVDLTPNSVNQIQLTPVISMKRSGPQIDPKPVRSTRPTGWSHGPPRPRKPPISRRNEGFWGPDPDDPFRGETSEKHHFFTFGAQKTCFFALFLPLQNRVEGSPTNRATGAFFRDEKGLEFCEKPPIFASESEKVGIFHVFACLEGELRFQGSPPLTPQNRAKVVVFGPGPIWTPKPAKE